MAAGYRIVLPEIRLFVEAQRGVRSTDVVALEVIPRLCLTLVAGIDRRFEPPS